ncbi:DUF6771 family protein [Sphingomonas oryzagri]
MVRESSVVAAVLARMPDWIRTDLSAKDARIRSRAEEALTARLAFALNGTEPGAESPE